MIRDTDEKFSRSFYSTPVAKAISSIEEEGRLLEANKALEAMLTERETALLRLNRLYAVLSLTNHAIVRAKDRETLFSNICRGAVEQGGFKTVWIGLIDDESGMVTPVSCHGDKTGFMYQIRISAREVPEGMGPTGSAATPAYVPRNSGGTSGCNIVRPRTWAS